MNFYLLLGDKLENREIERRNRILFDPLKRIQIEIREQYEIFCSDSFLSDFSISGRLNA